MTRTYLVTGGAGFIGSHLVEALLTQGERVVALDDLSTGCLTNLQAVEGAPRFGFVHGSVVDEATVDQLVERCDVVIHLAAAVGVQLVVERPLESFATNVRGAQVVMDAVDRHHRTVLMTSTSEVYGKNPAQPLAETADSILGNPTVNRWAYALAKSVDEVLALTYHSERGVPAIVARLFNTVGPRQTGAYGMVLPRLVHQALRGEPVTVFGDGLQTRSFCHVDDVVGALGALVGHPRAVGEVFNVGSAEEISIRDLADRIIRRTASPSELRLVPYEEAYPRAFEDLRRRVPDTTKLRALTGWELTHTLDDIIDDVVRAVSTGLAADPTADRGQ